MRNRGVGAPRLNLTSSLRIENLEARLPLTVSWPSLQLSTVSTYTIASTSIGTDGGLLTNDLSGTTLAGKDTLLLDQVTRVNEPVGGYEDMFMANSSWDFLDASGRTGREGYFDWNTWQMPEKTFDFGRLPDGTWFSFEPAPVSLDRVKDLGPEPGHMLNDVALGRGVDGHVGGNLGAFDRRDVDGLFANDLADLSAKDRGLNFDNADVSLPDDSGQNHRGDQPIRVEPLMGYPRFTRQMAQTVASDGEQTRETHGEDQVANYAVAKRNNGRARILGPVQVSQTGEVAAEFGSTYSPAALRLFGGVPDPASAVTDDSPGDRPVEDLAPAISLGVVDSDNTALELAIQDFIKSVGWLGEQMSRSLGGLGLAPWLCTAAAAATAYEVSRRKRRSGRLGFSLAGGAGTTTLSWFGGLPGSLTTEEN